MRPNIVRGPLTVVIEFSDERRAVAFERYLKSGSGVAFAQRHLRWRAALSGLVPDGVPPRPRRYTRDSPRDR